MKGDSIGTPTGGEAHVERWLDRYRTGELDEAARRRVEAHLAACADCARELTELEAFSATMARAFEAGRQLAAPSEPAWDRQRRRIVARTMEDSRLHEGWARVLRQYAPQAAMAVIALIALGVLYREGVRGPGEAERRLQEPAPAPSLAKTAGPARETGPQAAGAPEAAPQPRAEAHARILGAPAPAEETQAANEAEGAMKEEPGAARPVPSAPRGFAAGREKAPAEARVKPPAPAAAEPRRDETDEDRAKAMAGRTAAAAPHAPADLAQSPLKHMDELRRLDFRAHRALASSDTAEAARVLAFWRDSLQGRGDLDPERMRAAAALVDSLAALVGGTTPAPPAE